MHVERTLGISLGDLGLNGLEKVEGERENHVLQLQGDGIDRIDGHAKRPVDHQHDAFATDGIEYATERRDSCEPRYFANLLLVDAEMIACLVEMTMTIDLIDESDKDGYGRHQRTIDNQPAAIEQTQ